MLPQAQQAHIAGDRVSPVKSEQSEGAMPFVDAGDLRVHYLEHGAGEPIVFVHGNWASASWWEPALARLPQGWRGLAYDMRGRGQTAGPDSSYSVAALAADLAAFMDALGLASAHLVGHSLGSAVVLQLALEQPERARTLVAVAPPWVDGMPLPEGAEARQRALKADPAMFAQALKAIAPAVADDAYWRRLVAEGHQQRLAAVLGNLPALAEWRPGERLRAAGARALVLAGEHDILVTDAVSARAAEALGCRRIVLPGVGHSPPIEAPDQFVAALLAHIR